MRCMTSEAEVQQGKSEQPLRRYSWLRRVVTFAVVAIAVGLLVWQVRRADPAVISALLRGSDVRFVALALAFTLARFGVAAWRLAALTKRVTSCRFAPFVPITMAAQLAALAIPGIRAGASVLRAALASRRFGGGTGVHMGPNVLDNLVVGASWILVATALAPAALMTRASEWRGPLAALVAALATGVLVVLALRRFGPRLERWLEEPRDGTAGRLAVASHATWRSTSKLLRDPRALVLGLGGGVGFVVVIGLAQHAALLAMGVPVHWWLAMLTVAVGGAAGTATGAPGGIGVTEAAQIAFLQSQGIGEGEATAAVLLARGLHYGVIAIGGGLSALFVARPGWRNDRSSKTPRAVSP